MRWCFLLVFVSMAVFRISQVDGVTPMSNLANQLIALMDKDELASHFWLDVFVCINHTSALNLGLLPHVFYTILF